MARGKKGMKEGENDYKERDREAWMIGEGEKERGKGEGRGNEGGRQE